MAIIKTIEQLKTTVKVNQSSDFDVWTIYLNDAQTKFLVPYLGEKLVNRLENLDEEKISKQDKHYAGILPIARRVLGPFTLMLSMDEMGINIGSSGHTVTRTDKVTPASDHKIEKATESLNKRAWDNMEYLLSYMEENIKHFPEWKESQYFKNRQTKYFPTATIFQDSGLIDIGYSRLTFESLRQLIIRIEKTEITPLITEDGEKKLFDHKQKDKEKCLLLIENIRAFIGARVAELYTSQSSKEQRSGSSGTEFKPVIRPLYEDISENGNYYSAQVAHWKNKILSLLPDIGIEIVSGKLDWNNRKRKIFSAI